MSKLYVHHNLTAIESETAFGGGGGGGGGGGEGSTSNSDNNTEAANSDALLACTAQATTAGLVTGAGFAATGPASILIGTTVATSYVVTGQGACADVDLSTNNG